MIKHLVQTFVLGTTAALIFGCGGGGDSGASAAPVAASTTFPLQAGFQARIKAGSQDNYTVSGTCAGTATLSNGSTTAAVFEGVSGFAASQTVTLNFPNCAAMTSNALSGTSYFNANYAPIGTSIPGVRYETLPSALSVPVSVKVGDTAVLGALTGYADSSKASVTGQRVLSFVVEADTTSTVIINLISKDYNSSNQLVSTAQSRFRLTADGTLTSTTINVQYSTTSTSHLTYTKS